MSKWQPIETAPRDGRMLLGFAKRGATGGIRRVGVQVCAMRWHPTRIWTTVPSDYPIAPTHWQPLPPPPESE